MLHLLLSSRTQKLEDMANADLVTVTLKNTSGPSRNFRSVQVFVGDSISVDDLYENYMIGGSMGASAGRALATLSAEAIAASID